MKVNSLIRDLEAVGLSSVGDTYIFGSFVRGDGKSYNDIDIYIDADELTISEIKDKLDLLPFDYIIGSKYYAPGPKPTPKPPFPKSLEIVNDVLHVTVCKKDEAEVQPFYRTMISGKHHVLRNVRV